MKVEIIKHGTEPNEVGDKEFFAIGSVHEVVNKGQHGVYLYHPTQGDYLFLWGEVLELD